MQVGPTRSWRASVSLYKAGIRPGWAVPRPFQLVNILDVTPEYNQQLKAYIMEMFCYKFHAFLIWFFSSPHYSHLKIHYLGQFPGGPMVTTL